MSFAADDLSPLLTPPPSGQGLNFGTGRVIAWDNTTGENQVEYRGLTLTDLPILNAVDILVIAPGDVVSILSWQPNGRGLGSYFILGRFVTPPLSASAASFLQTALGSAIARAVFGEAIQVDYIATSDSTSSTSFGDLSTVGPTVANVEITDSGRALVFWGAMIDTNVPAGAGLTGGIMSYQISGATSSSPSTFRANRGLWQVPSGDQGPFRLGGRGLTAELETGLNEGIHTFEAKYRVLAGGSEFANFSDRILIVIPF